MSRKRGSRSHPSECSRCFTPRQKGTGAQRTQSCLGDGQGLADAVRYEQLSMTIVKGLCRVSVYLAAAPVDL
jgi:hypothetical protein